MFAEKSETWGLSCLCFCCSESKGWVEHEFRYNFIITLFLSAFVLLCCSWNWTVLTSGSLSHTQVSVCVCVREREREKVLIWFNIPWPCVSSSLQLIFGCTVLLAAIKDTRIFTNVGIYASTSTRIRRYLPIRDRSCTWIKGQVCIFDWIDTKWLRQWTSAMQYYESW